MKVSQTHSRAILAQRVFNDRPCCDRMNEALTDSPPVPHAVTARGWRTAAPETLYRQSTAFRLSPTVTVLREVDKCSPHSDRTDARAGKGRDGNRAASVIAGSSALLDRRVARERAARALCARVGPASATRTAAGCAMVRGCRGRERLLEGRNRWSCTLPTRGLCMSAGPLKLASKSRLGLA